MSKTIYLDYNATCPLRPEAQKFVAQIAGKPLNASAVHSFGREGRKLIEQARAKLANLVSAQPSQVIFNSGATEGNNTVLQHFAGERILVSAIEHPSVLEAAPEAERIPVTKDGIIDLDALETLLQEKPTTALVSTMLVNNETGTIQPLDKISSLAKKYGALVHCDAVQAAGRIPIDMATLGIDFLTLSSHKIGGPQGVGALALGLCGITPVLLHGGGQEKKARPGTENVAGIAGFGIAAELALQELNEYEALDKMRSSLESELVKIAGGDLTIHSQNALRVANTSLFSLKGTKAETLLMALDLEGIALSNGSACSSGTVKPSHVLQTMGVTEEEANGALRISMGWDTKQSDIDRFLEVWLKIYERLQGKTKTEGNKAKAHA